MINSKMKRAIKLSEGYFFSKETMNFWNSKVESGMYNNNTFVTSEDNYDRTKKLYSVRKYDWEKHEVKTITFQQHDNLDEAIVFAKSYREDE